MKFNLSILFILLLSFNFSHAQQQLTINPEVKKQKSSISKQPVATIPVAANRPAHTSVHGEKCGFAYMMNKAKAMGFNEAAYEMELKRLIQKRITTGQTAFTGIVTIPVIFHCVYNTGDALSTSSPNLPANMYQAQINQMNKDYANLSGSAYGVSADVRLRFCLAVVDTTGQTLTEPGIDRLNGTTRGWSNTNTMDINTIQTYFDGTIKPQSIWDPYSYFNVWTAPMDNSGLLGYSTFPAISTLPGLDNTETSGTAGCVIAWQSVGSVAVSGADASYGYGRTLTHESGHFFGLRHIWGDATCGDDYCNDTPPQDAETTGCPTPGTLNNCTPSGPKMFENYMDYSNDACLNTFTANQALRCQTAMDNSPRRVSLISSKACQARAGNSIQFASTAAYGVSETGNAGTCPNSRSFNFNLYVSDKASGAATVTFTNLGGTATQGLDYTISPSSVTYSANDNSVKTITLTILDDQIAEGNETIQLGYTISGTGVIAGPEKQTLSVTIVDDDVANISVNNTTPIKTVLSENFNASTNIPTGWTTELYDDGSGTYTPNQWVVSANGGVGTTGNAAHITKNTSTKTNQYTNTNISDAYLFTPLINAAGLRDLVLSFKWRCNGEVGYDEGYIGYIPQGQAVTAANVVYFNTSFSGLAAATTASTATLNLPLSLSNAQFYLVFNWFNDDSFGSNPPFTIDDVSVTGKQFAVATTTDADTAFSQYSGQTVSYYSKTATSPSTNRIIATIANPSQDLGCITASIQSAGTGKTALATTAGSYFRTDKVIKLTPAAANSTVTYQGTLYFTAAELSPTWTAAEIPTLKILKVKDGVSLSGTLTSADAQVITPTFADNSATGGYYSYTGNFTGFSQFMLVSPNTIVPIRLLSFEANARKNSIILNWSTAQEFNNKGFKIERSTDGINFEEKGWVAGKINSNVQSDYAFTDNFVQPNTVYYYRLRLVDMNDRQELSPVRQARISREGVAVTVSPVPAKDVLNLFISGTSKNADINLFNAQGQLARAWKNTSAAAGYTLNVNNLPAGIYMLTIILPEETLVKKIVLEK